MEGKGKKRKGEEWEMEIVLKCAYTNAVTANGHQQSVAVRQEVGCDDHFPLSERPHHPTSGL